MGSMSTISINYDLTACQTCIAMRTSDNKFTCRVDQKFIIAFETVSEFLQEVFF